MKNYLFLLLLMFSFNFFYAQDIIIKGNGEEMETKVLEITNETIKYKEFDYQGGPIRNVDISEVFMVIYENGKREKFTSTNSKKSNVQNSSARSEKTLSSGSEKKEYDGSYFMLGTGYGNSYGGAGLRLQWRFGGLQGFGFHLGAGYFPEAPVLASAGFKFFPYKFLYVNTQAGMTGVEYHYEYYYEYDGYNDYSWEDEYWNILYGASFLVGGDFNWGNAVGFGFNAGIGVTYNFNSTVGSAIVPAFDIGFIVRF